MYKIIQNNKVIDVVRFARFVRFLKYGHVVATDKSSAQGILGSDEKTVYSLNPNTPKSVTVQKITQEEFDRLKGLLDSNQEVCADETVLADIKRKKIDYLSRMCKIKITAGFSVELSDNEESHFKLTIEDQLNLMALENQLNAGAQTFIYHATGQPCKLYSRDEVEKIINTFRRFMMYHTTYFNVAKQYINSLTDAAEINKFTYGTDIADFTSDLVIRRILKMGGTF